MTQIVWKHFFRVDIRIPAQLFHIPPDIGTADRLTAFRDENGTGLYFLLPYTNYQLNALIIHCLAVILVIVLGEIDWIVEHKRSITLSNV